MSGLKAEEIQKFIDGDDTVYPKIFAVYKNKVNYMAIKILRNEADCEEVVQNTFIKVFEKRKDLKDASAFNTWIYRIAYNASLDLYRKNKRNLSSDNHDVEELSDSTRDTNYEVKKHTILESVRLQIESLPKELKEICDLWFLSGCSLEEISGILNVPKGTVKSRLHRARKQLRSDLQRQEITPRTFLTLSFPTFAYRIYVSMIETHKITAASGARIMRKIEEATNVSVDALASAIGNNSLGRASIGTFVLLSSLLLGGLGAAGVMNPTDTSAKNITEVMYLDEITNKNLQIGIIFDGTIKAKDVKVTLNGKKIKLDVVDKDRCTFIASENGQYVIKYKNSNEEIEIKNIDKSAPVLLGISADDGLISLSAEDNHSGIDFEKSYVEAGDKKISLVKIDEKNFYLSDALEKDATVRFYDIAGNYETYKINVEKKISSTE
ncbi:RNA polymerase sigma factor (sigma-70 family) [Breznakia sp. PF5-3]|uniref:RNA polymerase sigma factor n=1 Tax=unclassified Breznakia TaxID=2623764 RepID=UPI0024069E7A|nr:MULTISPECIES: sigma-70 family RNA polymerase sigma factor [unclassified Breznakia]MDL2276749.1 sigma-70 family RNA polymerase sigma factor [Breznakia sp. OttesenSCG-928-G09]MDF9825289.1 RNA polymerase sigma factor (sigma-70 family) [Breznakia sp. PM6-1]MDF9836165.1 RNA polymerase sigma factor (sigma-70 family) [Breznakia sp. PF5-3]MDF9837389.1 RNA polymerase sigma factor (sigma-70 family) [Breznakia sp. PFB2-8]MDF9859324.1 RNA polymerase sigma factor (sigma-70 family) [Breznakia sp. PH5-24]